MSLSRTLFDAAALRDAVDVERRARGLTWAALSRELGVGASAIQGLGRRSAVEADGALALCRWLGRAPESFAGREGPCLPDRGPAPVLRADTRGLHAALAQALEARGIGWADLAAEVSRVGMPSTAPMLIRYAHGGRADIDRLVILTGWLGRPVAHFVHWTWR
jgi:hypothetical protein